jgi:hypothetical protein
MKKTRLRMAALALGGALTLLAPMTAIARDRDENRGGNEGRQWKQARVEQRYDRGRDQHFGDRDDRYRDRDGDRDRDRGARFYFNYNPAPQGYYDAYGYWHPYYAY